MNKTGLSKAAVTILTLLAVGWCGTRIAQADYTYGEATWIPNVSRPGTAGPQISRDGLELYLSYGSQCGELWIAKRSTTREPWGVPVRSDFPANSAKPIGDGGSVSPDGLEYYFGEAYPMFIGGCTFDPSGYGGGDLWVARRATKSGPWGKPENLGPVVNTPDWEGQPCLSADGLSLYFSSERAGGYGTPDIYVATRRTLNDPWGPPVNLGAPLNTSHSEATPFISADGLSLYYSRGPTPMNDIYVSKRATTASPWGPPVRFDPVNSSAMEFCLSFSEENQTLYFLRSTNIGSRSAGDVWQVQVFPTLDFNKDGKVDEKDFLAMTQHWGQDYPLCDIGPMAWGDGVVDAKDQRVFLEAMEGRDFVPSPSLHASEVALDAVLRWTSPRFAKTRDVYFGISLGDVSSASRSNPRGVLVSQGQMPTAHDPGVLLSPGQTYYWRIDEIGDAPDFTIYRGPVLDFTTTQTLVPPTSTTRIVTKMVATASSAQPGMGPEKTIDGSGLDKNDGHSTSGTDMWFSTGVPPNWIQYQYDKVYALRELWVWNSNQDIEPLLGFGAKKVTIEYSVDGTTWTTLSNVPEFARAPGQNGYVHNTTVSFGGVSAKYVKLTIEKDWGVFPSTGLSEVRFFYLPSTSANEP